MVELKRVETAPLQDAATQAAHAATVIPQVGPVSFPTHWPAQADLVSWCQQLGPGMAALLVLLGLIYLLFGYNIFKLLVAFNAAVIGGLLGAEIADRTHTAMVVPTIVSVAFIAVIITLPLMKWAVAVLGGLFGAALGAGLWRTFGQDPHFMWAGAAIGLVLFGLLSFIVFRGCVMTYMSLQGATMLIVGLLGLVFKYNELEPRVSQGMMLRPFLLPMAILIPTVLGVMFQQNNTKPEKV